MSFDSEMQTGKLRQLSPSTIRRNPDNPRIFFRQEEMESLLASIARYGIQVPIAVYEDDGGFTLIDGERRWRCAKKLNLRRIPALVQPKPSALKNLLLMFNIHALREQWDYFTIANKLPVVIRLFEKNEKRHPNEIELSELTGLTRGQIRRCRFLLDLPDKYKEMMLKELELPRSHQAIGEDFFIEMERALKTVTNRVPEAIQDIDEVRDALVSKYRKGLIDNVTDFRKLSNIATSVDGLGVKRSEAIRSLKRIFNPNNDSSIKYVFEQRYESVYDEQKFVRNIHAVYEFLENVIEQEQYADQIDEEIYEALERLRTLINDVLEAE